ncbi:MAG: hypothetical protein HY711_01065 [Candidatus Melainabacteria bacterium]|nr:hypothetical protein [Candidatus Melainabacteria bacterium]
MNAISRIVMALQWCILVMLLAGVWHAPCVMAQSSSLVPEACTPSDGGQKLITPTGLSASPSQLKGRVRGAAVLTEEGLVKMKEVEQDLQKSCLQVMAEVTRKQTLSVRGPNVLPGGVVIQPFPNPSGTVQFGDLEPRKKHLDHFVSQTSYYVELLRNLVDALIIPDNKPLVELWGNVRSSISNLDSRLGNLKMLTGETKYDTARIGKEALRIYDDVSTVEELRKQVLGLMQK